MKSRAWPFLIFPAAVVIAAWYAAIRVGMIWPVAVNTVALVAVWFAFWWGCRPSKRNGDSR